MRPSNFWANWSVISATSGPKKRFSMNHHELREGTINIDGPTSLPKIETKLNKYIHPQK